MSVRSVATEQKPSKPSVGAQQSDLIAAGAEQKSKSERVKSPPANEPREEKDGYVTYNKQVDEKLKGANYEPPSSVEVEDLKPFELNAIIKNSRHYASMPDESSLRPKDIVDG